MYHFRCEAAPLLAEESGHKSCLRAIIRARHLLDKLSMSRSRNIKDCQHLQVEPVQQHQRAAQYSAHTSDIMATPTLSNPGKTVIKPSKLAHLVLRTSDMHRLATFYQTFLSATKNFQNEFMILLSYDDEHHRLGIVQVPALSKKDPQTCGLEHIAFTFDSINDLAMSYLQRKEHGILPFWCINHGPTTSMYYKDPDQNIVECQVENFETKEEAMEYMVGEDYAKNPLGVDFEMEDLIERIKGGESEESLKRRPDIGPRSIDSVPS